MAGEYGYVANPTIYSAPGAGGPGTTPAGYNPGYFGPTQYASSAPTSYAGAPPGYAFSASGLVPIGSGQGGGAGIQAYNPAIGGPTATRSFQAPQFTNSMSNWYPAGNANGGGGSNYANVASPMASQMMGPLGSGSPYPGFTQNSQGSWVPASSGSQGFFPSGSGGGATDRFGNPANTSSQGSFNSAYDPQNTAYNMMYRNQISPQLGQSNLQNYADYINQTGAFRNPQAGQAMASVAGAESSGNPFAVNPSSGAFGMNQWMNAGDQRGTNAMNMMGENYSPQSQAATAMGEIMGGGYNPTYSALNNPNSTMQQMRGQVVGNFEGLQNSPQQYAADMANAARYGMTLNSVPAYAGGGSISLMVPGVTLNSVPQQYQQQIAAQQMTPLQQWMLKKKLPPQWQNQPWPMPAQPPDSNAPPQEHDPTVNPFWGGPSMFAVRAQLGAYNG